MKIKPGFGNFTFGTNQALAPDGTAPLPAYSFSSDPNTGMFSAGADLIGFANGGTERARIGSVANGGSLTMLSNANGTLVLAAGAIATPDVMLVRDAAATWAQRNSTTTQVFRLYGTTDSGTANYERLAFSHTNGTSSNITVETAGTGGDDLDLALTAAGAGKVRINTALITATDGSAPASFGASNRAVCTGGPGTATQNGWLVLKDSAGATIWVPVWK